MFHAPFFLDVFFCVYNFRGVERIQYEPTLRLVIYRPNYGLDNLHFL